MKKVGDICHKARSDDHRCKYIYGVSFQLPVFKKCFKLILKMVRRDRNKINNLRDDLKKFKDTLWDLENSDGFQFCSKYAEKCSKGNKFGFEICFVGNIFVTNTLWYNSERPPRSPRLGRRTTGTGTTARDFRNGKMQNKFPDYDKFSVHLWFLHFILVYMVQISSLKVIFDQNQT